MLVKWDFDADLFLYAVFYFLVFPTVRRINVYFNLTQIQKRDGTCRIIYWLSIEEMWNLMGWGTVSAGDAVKIYNNVQNMVIINYYKYNCVFLL